MSSQEVAGEIKSDDLCGWEEVTFWRLSLFKKHLPLATVADPPSNFLADEGMDFYLCFAEKETETLRMQMMIWKPHTNGW